MRLNLLCGLATASGIALFSVAAQATPFTASLIPTSGPPFQVNYSTSSSVSAAAGAMNGLLPNSFNLGGLCSTISPQSNCVSLANAGPALNGSGLIPVAPIMIPNGDSNYDLGITVSDVSNQAGSVYEITLNGIYIGETSAVPSGNIGSTTAAKSTGTFHIVLNDGRSPGTYALGITNAYLANTTSPLFFGSALSLVVTETAVPEPGSLALVAAGLGLMGLLRRYRAGASAR